MGMSNKTAWLICLGFIGTMVWMLHEGGPARLSGVEGDDPSIARADMLGGGAATAARHIPHEPGSTAGQFEYRNAMENEATRRRGEQGNRIVAPPTIAAPQAAPVVLPPRFDPPAQRPDAIAATPDRASDPVLPRAQPAIDPNTRVVDVRITDTAARSNERSGPAADANGPQVLPPNSERTVVVQKGDNLTKIAQRAYGISDARAIQRIVAANPAVAKRKGMILAGESLAIPPEVLAGKHANSAPALARSADEPSTPTDRSAAREKSRDSGRRNPLPRGADSDTASTRVADAGAKPSADVVIPPRLPERAVARSADAVGGKLPADAPARAGDIAGRPKGDRKLPKSTAGEAPSAAPVDRVYVVKKGESLESIAARELKDPRLWKKVADLNGIGHANKIVAGMRLRLPASVRVASR